MKEKQEIRKYYKKLRDEMSKEEAATLSGKICSQLTNSDLFRKADRLYAYYPVGNEADVRLVAEAAWEQDKRMAFPKVFGEEMSFFEVTDLEQFKKGAFDIPEPLTDRPVDWRREGGGLLVLVPGTAFDAAGHRIGSGGGYYDRYFRDCNDPAGVTLMGIAYQMQIAAYIPPEAHDLTVSHLVTERGVVRTAT